MSVAVVMAATAVFVLLGPTHPEVLIGFLVAFVVGVSLSHSAYNQYFETTRVPINALQPGDLLFFGKDGVESIHHNAMYIGNGDMIEASQTGVPVRIRGWRGGDLVGTGRPG